MRRLVNSKTRPLYALGERPIKNHTYIYTHIHLYKYVYVCVCVCVCVFEGIVYEIRKDVLIRNDTPSKSRITYINVLLSCLMWYALCNWNTITN